MNTSILRRGMEAVETQDHYKLKDLYEEHGTSKDAGELYIRLLYHACTKRRRSTIIFLVRQYYEIFNDIEQIAIRQSFFYGKYKMSDKGDRKWYDECVLPLVRRVTN